MKASDCLSELGGFDSLHGRHFNTLWSVIDVEDDFGRRYNLWRYLGSGKYILAAIRKYGRQNFVKEVLYIFDNEEDMNLKEKEILTEEFISTDSNYNAGVGGEGGPHFRGKSHTAETKSLIGQKNRGKVKTAENIQKIKLANKRRTLSGWTHSAESREKMRQKKKEYWQKQRILREGGQVTTLVS